MRTPLRDVAVAFSLANLLCLPIWTNAVFHLLEPRNLYFLPTPPPPLRFLSAVAVVLSLGTLFWAGARLQDRRPRVRRLVVASFWISFACALNFVRLQVPLLHGGSASAIARSAAIIAIIAALIVVIRRRAGGLTRLAYLALLAASPFALTNLGQAIVSAFLYPASLHSFEASAPPAPEPRLPAGLPSGRRLVILLFDELDETIAFDQRSGSLHLPEFDRLRNESWVADEAFPVTNATLSSIPALVTGQDVDPEVTPLGPSTLRVRVGGREQGWESLPSLFSHARSEGGRVAIVGWYHPYCRIFGRFAEACRSVSAYPEPDPRHYFTIFLHTTLNSLPGSRFTGLGTVSGKPDWMIHRERVDQYQAVHSAALSMASAADGFDLLYVHYPIPHFPYVYDRARGDFAMGADYLDNLALADRALGEVRRALDRAGLGMTTALLVTSDHSNRQGTIKGPRPDYSSRADRVPLILFIPGQPRGVRHSSLAPGTLVHTLSLAYLQGQIRDYTDASIVAKHPRS